MIGSHLSFGHGPGRGGGCDIHGNARLPVSTVGVAAFQLLNPKAWVLVTTAAAAMSGTGSVFLLAALMTLVTGLCLSLWAMAGAVLSRLLARPRARRWFDRAMGGLLAVCAIGIVTNALA